ncbi:MAG: ComF family protein [Oceanospirillaceae bacterium]|jgi:ComF family protein
MHTYFINNWIKITQSCILCDLATSNTKAICDSCQSDLPWLNTHCYCCAIPLPINTEELCKTCIKTSPHFKQTIAAFHYLFPIDLILPKVKKSQQRYHLRWLAACLAKKITSNPLYVLPQAIIPVPISHLKKLRKGYNQTELLALELTRRINIKTDLSLVSKNRNTQAQAQLSAQLRKSNLKDAFDVRENSYHHLAIVDDVMTTAATVNEIAKVLQQSGVEKIDVWVLARTPV